MRRAFEPYIAMAEHAWRLAQFNTYLGLSERTLDAWPVEYVDLVLTLATYRGTDGG